MWMGCRLKIGRLKREQSLQLFARVDPREVNFSVVKEVGDRNHYAGYFYDTSDGGNGASEAVFKHIAELASTAVAISLANDLIRPTHNAVVIKITSSKRAMSRMLLPLSVKLRLLTSS